MRPIHTIVTSSVAAVSALALLAGPAAASLDGADVIRYHQDEVLEDPVRYVKQGERTPSGGCRFAWDGALPAGDEPVLDQELAFDPSSCTSLRARGVVLSRGEGDGDAAQSQSTGGAPAGDGTLPASVRRWSAYIHSWWEDPPQKDVSKVENTITWAPDGSCAAPSGSNPTWSVRRYWLSDTGWSFVGDDWTYGATCERVISGSDARFRNDDFCDILSGPFIDPEDTRTRHIQNIRGDANGIAHYGINSEKSGGCSFLLSFDWESRRTIA